MGINDSPNTDSTGDIWSVAIPYLGVKAGSSSGVWGDQLWAAHMAGLLQPLHFHAGYVAGITDLGELDLIFSGWVTVGIEFHLCISVAVSIKWSK